MVIAGKELANLCGFVFEPFTPTKKNFNGLSYGLHQVGYDVRLKQELHFKPLEFRLASTIECFTLPDNVMAMVHDKSSCIRAGIVVGNSTIDPGFRGWLTLELFNQSDEHQFVPAGSPIANIIFHRLSEPVEPYDGKYQDQPDRPVEAIYWHLSH